MRRGSPSLLLAAVLLGSLGGCADEPREPAPAAAAPVATAAVAQPEPGRRDGAGGAGPSGVAGEVAAGTPAPPGAAPGATPAAAAGAPTVVFLGDSLTAGLGLAAEQAFPALVATALADRGVPIRVVNAGVSGDTSAGGLRRIDWLLRQRPAVVVVALGANDALRGQPVAGIEANLRRIVERAKGAGARVLLVGIQVPPSYGDEYARNFAAIYPRLASELDVDLLPFLLAGVAGQPELNLPDGIHPNEAGHRRIADLVARHLEPLVRAEATAAAVAR